MGDKTENTQTHSQIPQKVTEMITRTVSLPQRVPSKLLYHYMYPKAPPPSPFPERRERESSLEVRGVVHTSFEPTVPEPETKGESPFFLEFTGERNPDEPQRFRIYPKVPEIREVGPATSGSLWDSIYKWIQNSADAGVLPITELKWNPENETLTINDETYHTSWKVKILNLQDLNFQIRLRKLRDLKPPECMLSEEDKNELLKLVIHNSSSYCLTPRTSCSVQFATAIERMKLQALQDEQRELRRRITNIRHEFNMRLYSMRRSLNNVESEIKKNLHGSVSE